MPASVTQYVSIRFSGFNSRKAYTLSQRLNSVGYSRRDLMVFAVASTANEAWNYIPAAPIYLPEGPWKQIPGGVTAANGFKAAGMYGGLRAKGEKPDLALVTCDVDAISAGAFTTNVVAAAPVVYCKKALDTSTTARAVLINAGQANAATGDVGYQDVIECSSALAKLLKLKPEEVLIESTGVIGQRIKKEALLSSLPKLVNLTSSTIEGADSAAVAITTTDLVSKSVAVESEVGGSARGCFGKRGFGKRGFGRRGVSAQGGFGVRGFRHEGLRHKLLRHKGGFGTRGFGTRCFGTKGLRHKGASAQGRFRHKGLRHKVLRHKGASAQRVGFGAEGIEIN
ncbi:hypothetical protein RHSIM_Rhsim04G0153900 [Rhododendron simsii]|uniref:Uncharacterized protein n=1 Tax=Rhododendron simsii TaxID=118357 RepID=A0A834GY28_RHOSS|nr:hypothetical protein RHSIM_Rhsim04G0153900 [Rhododendron simsii]